MLAKPISEIFHSYITKELKEYKINTLLDMGGKGKMRNRGFKVRNADIRYGVDCRDLPFKDNEFDATISIVTLEHVGTIDDQIKFIQEAVRVAKVISIHWFPINKEAEKFLKEIGHNHPCIIPNYNIIKNNIDFKSKIAGITTVREHFLLLSTMYPKLNIPKLYDYIFLHGNETFSIMLEVIK